MATREEIENRIEVLKVRLAARTGKAGFAGNCEAIKNEIARLGIELDELDLTPAP